MRPVCWADRTCRPDAQQRPFKVIGGGTQLGIKAVEEGEADIAAVSWAPDATAAPPGYRMTPIARDGLTIITHSRNPAQGLTLLQLRALYRGEVLDWAALGGPAGEPTIISREEGSGDRQAFETLVMGGERVSLSALVLPTAEAVAEYVTEHPAAIGYVSTAQQSDAVRPQRRGLCRQRVGAVGGVSSQPSALSAYARQRVAPGPLVRGFRPQSCGAIHRRAASRRPALTERTAHQFLICLI
jgi:hypothetical protein